MNNDKDVMEVIVGSWETGDLDTLGFLVHQIAVADEMEEYLNEDFVVAMVNLWKERKPQEHVKADVVWVIARILNSAEHLCDLALAMGVGDLLLDCIMGDKSYRIDSPSQLHCMWCCGNIGETGSIHREKMLSSGLMTYLADIFRAGNMCGEFKNSDYDSDDGNLLEEYCFMLSKFARASFPGDDFLQSAVDVWKSVLSLEKSPVIVSQRAMGLCLKGISCCLPEALSRFIDQDVLRLLLKQIVLKHKHHDETLVYGIQALSRYSDTWFVENEMKEVVPALCSAILAMGPSSGSLELLDLCIEQSPWFSLEQIQMDYLQLARSMDYKARLKAEKFAETAAQKKLDCVSVQIRGYRFSLLSYLNFDDDFQYYHKLLTSCIDFRVEDVFRLICDFAVEIYWMGQLIDAQDSDGWWCAAEIVNVDVKISSVMIHFTGFSNKHDEWIKLPSTRIAPAFTFTRLELPEESTNASLDASDVQTIMSCNVLGISSTEAVQDMSSRLNGDFQSIVNCARWMNRDNLNVKDLKRREVVKVCGNLRNGQ
eukprot:TRINITY_DN4841_c2_g1_i1.p1 TRINITY_DN4841_c2_g1~~TRINITY_DN4841_c2_g1_i1.p1  ORF type:complete len:539 (+),score=119.48 TRINITY_DN4841_c2_g1_i1:31-1647(+)